MDLCHRFSYFFFTAKTYGLIPNQMWHPQVLLNFSCNPWFTDVFNFTEKLCLDINILDDYDVDNKINHNYERALEIYNQYGDFANFILSVELNGPFITEKTELIDEYLEMLGTIPSH